MAFNPLDYLKQGNISFVCDLTPYDYKNLIQRVRESDQRNDIINGFINLRKKIKYFCFEIIYDMEEYRNEVFELLKTEYNCENLIKSPEKIKNILYNTTWGRDFVALNLDILINNKDILSIIFEYILNYFDNNLDIIKRLSIHSNLHVRCLFMKYLVENHADKVNLVYDDITKYLTSYTHQEYEQMTFLPDLMEQSDVSKLAISILNSSLDKRIWNEIKQFILTSYNLNDLAFQLLSTSNDSNDQLNEFIKDADVLFKTSFGHKHSIYRSYKQYLSQKIIDEFEKNLKYFNRKNSFDNINLFNIFGYGLWDELQGYVDKYLSMSKRDDYEFLGCGSTASSFRIGDYVFKLIHKKWSYEEQICPNIYLILKNLEEHYIRNENGHVVAGLEVQKYLSKKDVKITSQDLKKFNEELRKLGYYTADTLMGGKYGDNCGILDSYLDADCINPELLPEDFKKKPLVLFDRDMVYKIGNNKPKQIAEWCSF